MHQAPRGSACYKADMAAPRGHTIPSSLSPLRRPPSQTYLCAVPTPAKARLECSPGPWIAPALHLRHLPLLHALHWHPSLMLMLDAPLPHSCQAHLISHTQCYFCGLCSKLEGQARSRLRAMRLSGLVSETAFMLQRIRCCCAALKIKGNRATERCTAHQVCVYVCV